MDQGVWEMGRTFETRHKKIAQRSIKPTCVLHVKYIGFYIHGSGVHPDRTRLGDWLQQVGPEALTWQKPASTRSLYLGMVSRLATCMYVYARCIGIYNTA